MNSEINSDYAYGISLAVAAKELLISPKKFTEMIGISPTIQRAVGESRRLVGSNAEIFLRPAKKNIWVKTSEKLYDCELDCVWESIKDDFLSNIEDIDSARDYFKYFSLTVQVDVLNSVPNMRISEAMISDLARMKWRVDFDFLGNLPR